MPIQPYSQRKKEQPPSISNHTQFSHIHLFLYASVTKKKKKNHRTQNSKPTQCTHGNPHNPPMTNPYPIQSYPPLPLCIGHNRKEERRKKKKKKTLPRGHKTPQHRRSFVLIFCKQNLNLNPKTLENLGLKRE